MKFFLNNGRSFEFNYDKETHLFEAPYGSDVYKHGDKFYVVRSAIQSRDVGQVKEVTIDFENTEENYESNVKCPVCGWEDQDSWEILDDEGTTDCGRCGAVLNYTRIVTIDYCTSVEIMPVIYGGEE